MTACEQIREQLPWYITGSIEFEEAERIASHLRDCDECRREFVEAAIARHRFNELTERVKAPIAAVQDRLIAEFGGGADDIRVDFGSLMLGLRLGIAAANRRHPIHGELHLLGKRVPIIGKRKKGA